MTLPAVVVHQQHAGRDELAVGGPRLGRVEVALPLGRAGGEPPLRVLAVQRDHDEAERPHPAGEASAPLPLEPRPGLPVADVEPDRDHRQHQVQPVRHVAAD